MNRVGMTTSALVFLAVVLVVLGSVGALALQRGMSGNPAASQTSTSTETTASNGLRLVLSLKPTEVYPGGQVSVGVADWNTLGTTIAPSLPANQTMEYALGVGPCSQLPLGIGLYQGNYLAGNLSAQGLLGTYKPGYYPCPAEFPVDYYSFAANSDSMSLYSLQPSLTNSTREPTLMWTQPDNATLQLSGYWTGGVGNASFHTFAPGVYTVVGMDYWGQEVVSHFTVQGGTGSTTTGGGAPAATSSVADSLYGLQLRASMNATEISPGQSLGVEVSEFNTLNSVNNVTKSSQWQVQASLGSCPNIYDQPFGVAVYQGYYDAQNVTQGTQLPIFPVSACPMFIRLVTGYLFQPQSDNATVLPGSGSPGPLTGNVTISDTYAGAGRSQPLAPGVYTLVAADEWGALAFLYFRVL